MYAMNRLSAMKRPGLQMKRLWMAMVLDVNLGAYVYSHHLWRAVRSLLVQLVKLSLEQLKEVLRGGYTSATGNKDYLSARPSSYSHRWSLVQRE